jgi:hypothetical protein
MFFGSISVPGMMRTESFPNEVSTGPPLLRVPGYRSSGLGFDSRRYQIFREVVGLKRGPISLVRIIEELLVWKRNPAVQSNSLGIHEKFNENRSRWVSRHRICMQVWRLS